MLSRGSELPPDLEPVLPARLERVALAEEHARRSALQRRARSRLSTRLRSRDGRQFGRGRQRPKRLLTACDELRRHAPLHLVANRALQLRPRLEGRAAEQRRELRRRRLVELAQAQHGRALLE